MNRPRTGAIAGGITLHRSGEVTNPELQIEAVDLSIVIPMYNEEENVVHTAQAVRQVLEGTRYTWEILLVDDGSRDDTLRLAQELASQDERICALSYSENGGQGKAMKVGFQEARGAIVATIDADLSYGPDDLLHVIEVLSSHPETDIVVGSPYIPGGQALGVPASRLFVSRVANQLVGASLGGKLHTVTGILRAYRRQVVRELWLESNGPEINMEILSKALATGFRVREVPATLKGRVRGQSKLRFGRTFRTYLLFSLFEKPFLLFGLLGGVLLLLGGLVGLVLLFDFFSGGLNPERPLMTVMLVLILVGLQFFSFAFLGSQIVQLRREIYRLQHRQSVRDS